MPTNTNSTTYPAELQQAIERPLNTISDALRQAGSGLQMESMLSIGKQFDSLQRLFSTGGDYAAAALVDEMSQAAATLLNDEAPTQTKEKLDILRHAQLILQARLRRDDSTSTDTNSALLLTVNELRAARQSPLLTETDFFNPDLSILPRIGMETDTQESGQRLSDNAKTLHPYFVSSRLAWSLDPDDKLSLQQMKLVIRNLESASYSPRLRQLWWIMSGLLEALNEQKLAACAALRQLLSQVDDIIERLTQNEEAYIERHPPLGLLKNALFYIGQCHDKGKQAKILVKLYHLDELIPDDLDLAINYQLTDHSQHSFQHDISSEMEKNLQRFEHAFNRYSMHQDHSAMEKLKQACLSLTHVADTLQLLGREQESKILHQEIQLLQKIIAGQEKPRPMTMMNISRAIARIKARLAKHDFLQKPERDTETPAATIQPADEPTSDPIANFIHHCLRDVENLEQFIAEQKGNPKSRLPTEINATIRALHNKAGLMGIDEFTATTELLQQYADNINHSGKRLTPELLDIFTEFCATTRELLNDMLKAEQHTLALPKTTLEQPSPLSSHPPDQARAPLPASPPPEPSKDIHAAQGVTLSDPDLLKIFADEAATILDKAEPLVKSWQTTASQPMLTELQSLLQRLKGSARMTGIKPMADIIHAMTLLITRLIQGRLQQQTVRPPLLSAFKGLKKMLAQAQQQQSISIDPRLLTTLNAYLDKPSAPQPPIVSSATESGASKPDMINTETAAEESKVPASPADSRSRLNRETLETLIDLSSEASSLNTPINRQTSDLQNHLFMLDKAAAQLDKKIDLIDIGENSRHELKRAFSSVGEQQDTLSKIATEISYLIQKQQQNYDRLQNHLLDSRSIFSADRTQQLYRQAQAPAATESTPEIKQTGSLLLRSGQQLYAINSADVSHIQSLSVAALRPLLQRKPPSYQWQQQSYPIRHLDSLLNYTTSIMAAPEHDTCLLLIRHQERTLGLLVDELVGQRDNELQPSGPQLGNLKGIQGLTKLEDGKVVLILDAKSLVERVIPQSTEELEPLPSPLPAEPDRTVLIADDSLTARKVTERLLRRNQLSTLTAADGLEAIKILEQQAPDIILLDMEMPGLNGLAIARKVRASRQWQHIPIIMTSAYNGQRQRQLAQEAGIDVFLGKPYQEAELLEHISRLSSQSRAAS